MRLLNLGIHATRQTTLAVRGAGTGSLLRITSSETGKTAVGSAGATGALTATLAPGHHVLTIDGEARARGPGPLSISADADVKLVSAPGDAQGRALVAWTGRSLELAESRDPWPRPPPRAVLAGPAAPDDSRFQDLMRTLADATPPAARGGAGPAPELHALLIGIDAYDAGPGRDRPIYRNLRGAVRDVLEVERFLLAEARIRPERITKLVAPQTPDGSPRPTYASIVGAWHAILEEARPGDVVYIHYSGHGNRAATQLPALKASGLDEVLVPCDINDRVHGRYLRDFELATLLARMAQKGLLTTLVLDACHSGTATRGDAAQARQGEFPDEEPRDSLATSLVAPAAELEAIARELEHGPRGLEVAWAVDAAGRRSQLTTVIAACHQFQSAFEYAIDGTHRQGALTYYWLEALRQRHAAMTYRDAYRHVYARVHATFAQQSPVLLGAADRLVLSTPTLAQAASIPVLAVSGEQVTLGAGASSLLEVGTRLALIPRELLPELAELSRLAQVEVTSAGATTSIARLVVPAAVPAAGGTASLALGAQAVVVTYAPRLSRSVQLLPSADAPTAASADASAAAPTDASAAASTAALGALAAALAADTSKLLAIAGPPGPQPRAPATAPRDADFQVAVDRSAASGQLIYSILDPGGAPLPNLRPEIPIALPDGAARVRARLVHLARYRNVQLLANSDPGATLANKLAVTLHADQGGALDPAPLPDAPTFAPGQSFWLRVKNRSLRPLLIGILDLDADWSITLLDDPWELDPGKQREVRLTAGLRDDYARGTDILKVIATRELASFEWLTLPALDEHAEPGRRGGASRPEQAPASPFEALLRSLQDPEQPPRAARVAAAPMRDWTEAQLSFEVVR